MNAESFRVRKAQKEDCDKVLALMREFAEYVNLTEYLIVDRQKLENELFEHNAAEVLLAEVGEEPIGYALYFNIFSSFSGTRGVYLDDLYISKAHRNKGYGKALLRTLVSETVEKGFERLEWKCLNWNTLAQEFYKSFGANSHDDSMTFSLEGNSLNKFSRH
ncbi:GNAT family N-acetyltransferase [Desulfosporosinus sp. SB140]|uniref:GNAT family N-acetyltransferase n=1 Tax=Desulfosporosinus paludis TaxID=3115649 RepID=UPI00388D796F